MQCPHHVHHFNDVDGNCSKKTGAKNDKVSPVVKAGSASGNQSHKIKAFLKGFHYIKDRKLHDGPV